MECGLIVYLTLTSTHTRHYHHTHTDILTTNITQQPIHTHIHIYTWLCLNFSHLGTLYHETSRDAVQIITSQPTSGGETSKMRCAPTPESRKRAWVMMGHKMEMRCKHRLRRKGRVCVWSVPTPPLHFSLVWSP